MNLIEKIKSAGIVGCGGAAFPTHIKLDCKVRHLIINAAECEPLLHTDQWFVTNKGKEIIEAIEAVANEVDAKYSWVAIKETHVEAIKNFQEELERSHSKVQIFYIKSFYPVGDEQTLASAVTGETVPPSGLPLDIGVLILNIATVYGIYQAIHDVPFTHKYLTVTGDVEKPMILKAPIGASFLSCLEAAGGTTLSDYHIISGGPMMGRMYTREEAKKCVVTKLTSGIMVLPNDAEVVKRRKVSLQDVLKRAKTSCEQCTRCTSMCPRYLSGHPLQPHKIISKLTHAASYEQVLNDEDIRQVEICSGCGVCETFACPMGVQPRQVNRSLKALFRAKGIAYEKPEGPFCARPERQLRHVPTQQLARRLGVLQYYDRSIAPLGEPKVTRAAISLKQHAGSPAKPLVGIGDHVVCGQLIGKCAEGSLGANIHASIEGVVTEMGIKIVIQEEVVTDGNNRFS